MAGAEGAAECAGVNQGCVVRLHWQGALTPTDTAIESVYQAVHDRCSRKPSWSSSVSTFHSNHDVYANCVGCPAPVWCWLQAQPRSRRGQEPYPGDPGGAVARAVQATYQLSTAHPGSPQEGVCKSTRQAFCQGSSQPCASFDRIKSQICFLAHGTFTTTFAGSVDPDWLQFFVSAWHCGSQTS